MSKIWVVPEENLDAVLGEIQNETAEIQQKVSIYIGRLLTLGGIND